ncbi:hypothetical protein NC653_002433 [Populus alba x Populus x berolinensis]|uniref:Uncharacterized protein n=1 Tax=Populus alba x Populus x berolinensis TaxID=444605 RepID=A0AAD6RPH6_9ROSI|nr:hypothetical protein NC653_002433 [Populus alba x Populus x berolinensis]
MRRPVSFQRVAKKFPYTPISELLLYQKKKKTKKIRSSFSNHLLATTGNKKTIQPLSSALSLFATVELLLSCPTLTQGTIAAASTVPLT